MNCPKCDADVSDTYEPNEFVERLAKILGNAVIAKYGGTTMSWPMSPERRWSIKIVRDLLKAMRVPTAEMLEAGAQRWHPGDWRVPAMSYLADAAVVVWERAIDAAQK